MSPSITSKPVKIAGAPRGTFAADPEDHLQLYVAEATLARLQVILQERPVIGLVRISMGRSAVSLVDSTMRA